jgi:hypothetical protein
MNIAALKEQARALERRGDTAAALDLYESILTYLETSSGEPEAPLYVKLGDLSLKTGQAAAAVAMFERAARCYAALGSHRSVIALCVKILRTDASRNAVYFQCARVMLEHEQVEPARLVLLDYAERARMRKTLSKLRELDSTPDAKLKPMLERLLDVADRSIAAPPPAAAPPSQPTATPTISGSSVRSSEPQPVVAFTPEPAPAAEAPPEAPPEPARPLRDTSVFEAISLPESPVRLEPPALPRGSERADSDLEAPQQSSRPRSTSLPSRSADASEPGVPAPTSPSTPKPAATVTPAVQEEPSVPRRRSFGAGIRGRSARPTWAIPALAAAAVAVFGVTLLALGAFSSGGELGAEPPRSANGARAAAPGSREAQQTLPATGGTPAGSAAADSGFDGSGGLLTLGGFNAIEERQEEAEQEQALGPLDQRALASATEAVKTVDVGAIDAPSVDFIADAGRITNDPAALSYRERARATPATQPARGPDIVIEGLEVEGVARSSASYQVVQRLPSGTRITLTVEPFANAPAGETGTLRVEAIGGDSAQGSVRFGAFFVSAQGGVTPTQLEELLDRLVERGE